MTLNRLSESTAKSTSTTTDQPYTIGRANLRKEDANEGFDFDQEEVRRHSPIFGIGLSDPAHPPNSISLQDPAYDLLPRAQPTPQNFDFTDGKSMGCNRTLTFDDFVPRQQMGVDKPAKKIGATWDVVRAIVKLKRPLKKMREKRKIGTEGVLRRMSSKRGTRAKREVDREALLG